MFKEEFTKKVAKKAEMTIVETKKFVDAFFETMKEAYNNDERVELRGFGTFEKVTHKSRKAYNFQTKGTTITPTKNVLKFKMSSLFNKNKK